MQRLFIVNLVPSTAALPLYFLYWILINANKIFIFCLILETLFLAFGSLSLGRA